MANEMIMDGKKYIEKDEYASKGVAGTALGLSIGALGLELLKNGGINLSNILGGCGNQQNQEETAFGLYKGYRDADDAIMANFKTVTLIHGKGTGALKKYLWVELKRDSRVQSFRIGQFGEGDGGVTVLELK